MHDAYTIGIPVLVILIANFVNRSELKDFRAEMNAKFDKVDDRFERMQAQMDRRFDAIDAELRYFHGVTGKLDGRIEAIEKRK
jgi:GTPase